MLGRPNTSQLTMQQFYIFGSFFSSFPENATVYNLCTGGAEGKHHSYFFPFALKKQLSYEKVTKPNHHSQQTCQRVCSQWRSRENTFGLQRKSQLCSAELGKAVWEPEVFIRKCQKAARPSQQVEREIQFASSFASFRHGKKSVLNEALEKKWKLQTITV